LREAVGERWGKHRDEREAQNAISNKRTAVAAIGIAAPAAIVVVIKMCGV
jgi:hypothetical protein